MTHEHGGIGEKAEELLETIWVTLENDGVLPARDTNVRPVSLQRLGPEQHEVPQLLEAGLVQLPSAGEVQLTPQGRDAAENIIRRHRLAERLVVDVFDLHGEEMEPYACRFEHLVHAGLEERICTLLGHPRVCPHDKPIPRGPCCREERHEVGPVVVQLPDLHPGQRGTIAYLYSEDQSRLNKLLAMGVLPGADIELQRRIPTFVFRVGFSQFAVDHEVASAVYVRLES